MKPRARAPGAARLLAAVALATAALATQAATVQVIGGAGFSDNTAKSPEGGNSGTTLGQQRTILFNAAAQIWGSALGSNQTIKIAAAFETLNCTSSSGVLGSAGPTDAIVLTDGSVQRFFPVALAESLAEANLNGSDVEIEASFNARIDLNDTGCLGNTRWYYGLNGPVPANTIALLPTVLHELGHGLGVLPLLCSQSGGCGSTPRGGYFSNVPDVWSDFVRDNSVGGTGTNKLWVNMTNAERVASFTHDPFLVWDGPSVTNALGSAGQAAAALNEGRIRLYAPSSFQLGSSVAHFHEDASPNLLMEPFADADVFNQTDLTDCMLQDMGWINSRCGGVATPNRVPTLNAIANPAAINEDAAQQTVNLSGIGDGDGNSQVLTVTASSGNTAVIPHPTVSYTSPNSTGSLSYTPVANASGSAVITVTVRDNGGTANGGIDSVTRTFTVSVNPLNDPPSATNLSVPETYFEDTPRNLTDMVVTDIDSSAVTATLTLSQPAAGSLNTGSAGGATSSYNAGSGVWSATGPVAGVNTLLAGATFTPAAGFSGNFSIATQVSDGSVAVTGIKPMNGVAVNDSPTLNAIFDPAAIPEGAGAQTVQLSGIGAGGGEAQTLSVTAISSDTGIVPHPKVTYSSPQATATLSYVPVPERSGSVTITVTVSDNGGTANGGVDRIARTFTVNITAVNDAPTLNALASLALMEDDPTQIIALAGISAGPQENQIVTITAASDNPELVPAPIVSYGSGANGAISLTPVANRSGTATLTVTATDNGGTANGGINSISRSFQVNVAAVNDAPTLQAPANLELSPTPGPQLVTLQGIGAGPGDPAQTLTVTAVSSNPAIVPQPVVAYLSPGASATLSFTPSAGVQGASVITVTVSDDGGTANGGADTRQRSFTVLVGSDPVFANGFE